MNSTWPLDWVIHEMEGTGLLKQCLVCFKLFSLDERLILDGLGALANSESNSGPDCLRLHGRTA